MEQLEYNLLFRWFVGLGMDDEVWAPTTVSKNRDPWLEGDLARAFFEDVVAQARERRCRPSTSLSTARCSKRGRDRRVLRGKISQPPARRPRESDGEHHGNGARTKRINRRPIPDSRLFKKAIGHKVKLAFPR
jgi:hypothetical protein